jgi:hypothetical protein
MNRYTKPEMELFRIDGTSRIVGAANRPLAATVFRVGKSSLKYLTRNELKALVLGGGVLELCLEPPVIRHLRLGKRLLRETCGTGQSLAEFFPHETPVAPPERGG